MNQIDRLPDAYRRDIIKATRILSEAGCSRVFLFGSLVNGEFRDGSDIDLAIRGCPKGQFFRLWGRLLLELDHAVDLVNLDRQNAFGGYLEKEGELVQVG